MMQPNPNYVIQPFNSLLEKCQNNVLLGLRIVENLNQYPESTDDEKKFFNIQMMQGGLTPSVESIKGDFKTWLIRNGFEDIQKCIRLTLENLVLYKEVEKLIASNPGEINQNFEMNQKNELRGLRNDQLMNRANSYFEEPLLYQNSIESINIARNCIIHTDAIVTDRHANSPERDKLIIEGNRFRLFFKNETTEVDMELGVPGPENASLMMGGEKFEIAFGLGERIDLSLKNFIDIFHTCIFIRADVITRIENL